MNIFQYYLLSNTINQKLFSISKILLKIPVMWVFIILFSFVTIQCGTGRNINRADTDTDRDGIPDIEDTDDDNDRRLDNMDNCPRGAINWNSFNVFLDGDGDGCRDDEEIDEDDDEDNDGIPDDEDPDGDNDERLDNAMPPDLCPRGLVNWNSSDINLDRDMDGCRDDENNDEDPDDDNDGRLDNAMPPDLCPRGMTNWNSSDVNLDNDSDGCRDEDEDDDDDNDGILDVDDDGEPLDLCPRGAANWNSSDMNLDADMDGCRDDEDEDDDNDGFNDSIDVDDNGNGLIEIDGPEMLDNIRNVLNGSSYNGDTNGCGNTSSSVGRNTCNGYELTRNLVFNSSTNWLPIGNSSNEFNTIFNGNGYTIANLSSKHSNLEAIGIFGVIGTGATITNLGLLNAEITYNGSSNAVIRIGGLVGEQLGGTIAAVYATGTVSASGGDNNYVGGLVGSKDGGVIVACYTAATVSGGNGDDDRVGGLVGRQAGSNVVYTIASYATGEVSGGGGSLDYVGGLVGELSVSSIIASYATGNAANGIVGGLVGFNGRQEGRISASYGFGETRASDTAAVMQGGPLPPLAVFPNRNPMGSASGLTPANAGMQWATTFPSGFATYNISSIWDFTNRVTSSGGPSLRYLDYDGDDPNSIDYCGRISPLNRIFPTVVPGSRTSTNPNGIPIVCGETPLPGQY